MKEWSVRIVMTVNKKHLPLLALVGFLSLPSLSAQAAEIVPSLYNVQDVVVDLARIGNENAATNCGVFKRKVSDQTLSSLLNEKIPARSSMGKDKTDKSKISVDLIPAVVSLVPREKMCVSWVSFNVQSRNAINIPPSKYHRDVNLTYWKGGLLVSTSNHAHARGVKEAIIKLVGQFVRQYHADQPPQIKKK